MIINNSKKALAAKIRNSGFVWPDSGKWAIQDKDGEVFVCSGTSVPVLRMGEVNWEFGEPYRSVGILSLESNWFQFILSRAEYFHLYPAPDADGWIEWKGGECPVNGDSIIDLKLSDGDEFFGVDADWDWQHGSGCDIVAYRLHKPEQAEPEFCESVMRSIQEPEIHSKNTALTQVDDIDVVESKPTIEQLAADYRNRKDYADRRQKDADSAKAEAESKLAELVAAGKEIGLVVSVETTESKCADGVMQITKRSQLELGDVIWIGRSGVKEDERRLPEGEYQVVKVGTIGVLHNGSTFYPDFSFRSWRFIRRP